MRIEVFADYDQMSAAAAALVERAVSAAERPVLGFATGATPIGLYRALVARHRAGALSFSRARSFNLDEYVGLPASHPQSYRSYMRENLFDAVDFAAGACRVPDGQADSLKAECEAYEAQIAAAGGIDLQVLGIGTNGHIGFNEPGTPFGTLTHVATLSERTRQSNAVYFAGVEAVPKRAISMGIRTIMNARRLVLLASGSSKAEAIRHTVSGPVTPEVPSSVLQLHPDLTLLLDRAAAAALDGVSA
ncbi:MAG TPA: glucosamine-6-phosphate deaminase [Limnochordia bacterium]|nr:glucosamine-6-phosphate deaminase [Limnochordia bacterium]